MGDIAVTLSSSTTTTLIKLCGMLGSDHIGERANAALMADKLVRSAGLTWSDIIVPPRHHAGQHHPHDWRGMRDFCAAHFYSLRERERDFVDGLADWRGRLSEKQMMWLVAIYSRLQREAA